MEQVTGIEPASPAWKAGALTIVLHLRLPSVEIVSLDILTYNFVDVNPFRGFFSSSPAAFHKRMNQPAAIRCSLLGKIAP